MKKCITATLIGVMMILNSMIVLCQTHYEVTYINNGDFDNDLSGWGQTWQSGTGTIEVVKENGNKVLHMQSDTGRCYIHQKLSNITEGDRLTLSFRMKIEELNKENDGRGEITIGFNDKSGVHITQHYYTFYEETNGKWVYKSIDLMVPKGVGDMSILVRLGLGGDIYYDDIEVTDFENMTELKIMTGELELYSIPDGIEEVTANLHYVPEVVGENGNIIFAAYENQADGRKKLVGIEIKPFLANKTVYIKADMKIPQKCKGLTFKAYVWKDGQTSDLICKSVSLPRPGRSEVFDVFAVDKMRGAYGAVEVFYNKEVMQRLECAGINTFIFNIMGQYYSGDINKNPNALDAVCADMEKYVEETGNYIFMKASYGSGSVMPNVKYGKYHLGEENELALPCPLSEEYWEAEMLSRLEVVARHPRIIGVVFDMEMYSGGETKYPRACMCQECVDKYAQERKTQQAKELALASETKRYKYLTDNRMSDDYNEWMSGQVTRVTSKIREKLHSINPNLIIGIMPTLEWLSGTSKGLGTEEMPLVVFDEATYGGILGIIDTGKVTAEINDLPVVFATGLWAHNDNAIKKSNFSYKVKQAYPKDLGYWIYSITTMEQDPQYYEILKIANDEITNK